MRWDLPRSRKWKFDDADNSAPLTGCHAYRSRQDMRRDSAPLTAETHHPKGKRCKSFENMVPCNIIDCLFVVFFFFTDCF